MSAGLDVVALARRLRDLNFDESTIVQICKQEREEHERKEKEERERKEKERERKEKERERKEKERERKEKERHTWVRKASPIEAAAYLPVKPPSETPRISDINSNDKIFGIVVLPPSSHYLALEIVQQAEALLSPAVIPPQEGIHTDLISAYSRLSHVHATLRHEPYFSAVITPALHEHFVTTVLSPEQGPVSKVVHFSHQASIGSGTTHVDWLGVDSQWHPVVMGDCKMERKHFDDFGGQVGNEVVRLGLLPTEYDMRQKRQHLFYPLTNINVCKDIVTAYLVLHVTRPEEVTMVADMKGLPKNSKAYYLAFLRLGSAKISTDPEDQRAVWALLTACKEFVTERLPSIIEDGLGSTPQLTLDREPFPCPDRGMKGWTCGATYGPNVQLYEHQSESWVLKHYDYWGRRSGAFSTSLYQIAPTDVREPPCKLLEALGALEKTGKFYKTWVVETLAEGVTLLRYPRVKTVPCGRNAHKQLASVVEQVQALHKLDIVHGDILLRNILFCNSWQLEDWMTKPPGWKMEDQTNDEDEPPSPSRAPSQNAEVVSTEVASAEMASPSEEAAATTEEATAEAPVAFLIDFDLSRHEGEPYVSGYNYTGNLKHYRHPDARPDEKIEKSHDGYALARVAERILVANGARENLIKALEDLRFDDAIKLCNECTGLQTVEMVFSASSAAARRGTLSYTLGVFSHQIISMVPLTVADGLDVLIVTTDMFVRVGSASLHGKVCLQRIRTVVMDEAHTLISDASYRDVMDEVAASVGSGGWTNIKRVALTGTLCIGDQEHLFRKLGQQVGGKVYRLETMRRDLQLRVLHGNQLDFLSHVQAIVDTQRVMRQANGERVHMMVFCDTVNEVKLLCDQLHARGYVALPYYTDLEEKAQKDHVVQWQRGECDVIVATSCLSTGVDLLTIRHVLWYGNGYNVYTLAQAFGRAGRDKQGGTAELWLPVRRGPAPGMEKFVEGNACRSWALGKLLDPRAATCFAAGQPLCDVCAGTAQRLEPAIAARQQRAAQALSVAHVEAEPEAMAEEEDVLSEPPAARLEEEESIGPGSTLDVTLASNIDTAASPGSAAVAAQSSRSTPRAQDTAVVATNAGPMTDAAVPRIQTSDAWIDEADTASMSVPASPMVSDADDEAPIQQEARDPEQTTLAEGESTPQPVMQSAAQPTPTKHTPTPSASIICVPVPSASGSTSSPARSAASSASGTLRRKRVPLAAESTSTPGSDDHDDDGNSIATSPAPSTSKRSASDGTSTAAASSTAAQAAEAPLPQQNEQHRVARAPLPLPLLLPLALKPRYLLRLRHRIGTTSRQYFGRNQEQKKNI
ncbi:uncharacterized protein MONBRDRAFT_9312 [Monosiga brevicollis MX1]|uniref:Helicase C-terminal domain-containing protein n=1 Tax=Monosiga brevicollis TaxID=81824 RepID=A9V2R3_MONBE|nr:uncharacterized protein MONBRDRAFT_9312 [Monosiga brevicollis MX1]EDQ88056.1 predicted protein [Monosiga brevicollis MX1]|eukprot:XP_001747132.1 hypothetical protein [Monosiga brevicollis MX1]